MKIQNPALSSSIYQTILQERLIDSGEKILVCVSGGADSITLLHIMLELRDQLNLTIGIAHLDHQLRGKESERDCDFVKMIAEKQSLPFHSKKASVKTFQIENRLSLEDAARQIRYRFFYETAKSYGYTKILTAHNANDNAELILMNLFRGSGLSGISGIPTQRDIVVRPLLWTTRDEIISYIQSQTLTFVTDSSNSDKTFLRNRVRHDLIPLIKTHYNDAIIDTLNRTSRLLQDENKWINSIVETHLEEAILSKTEKELSFSIPYLNTLDKALRRRLIRHAIKHLKGNLNKITMFHVDLGIDMAASSKKDLSADLPDRIRLYKKKGTLIFKRHAASLRNQVSPPDASYLYMLNTINDNETLSIPEISVKLAFTILDKPEKITYHNNTAWIDLDHITFPMQVRSPKPGDRFIPLGMNGSQTVKKFFSGKKISGKNRLNYPLVISHSDIIWIAGQRIHNAFRIRPNTKKVLKIELFLD